MKSRKRFVWPLLALVALAAIAGVWWWDGAHQSRAQILTLPNGDRYEFAGVTYSRRNVPPEMAAQLASWLPKRLAFWAQNYFRGRISQWNLGEKYDEPRLFVWFRPVGTNAPGGVGASTFNVKLSDKAGVEGGVTGYVTFGGGVTWSFAEFSVFPRRTRVIECNLYPFGGTGNGSSPILMGHLAFPNPWFGRFRQWQAEAIPATKNAGDLEVRLDDIMTGSQPGGAYVTRSNGSMGPAYRPAVKGQNASTGFGLTFKPADTNENWVVHNAELSDVTGNVLSAKMGWGIGLGAPQRFGPKAVNESLPGTLWPDESAWRLKLQMKRALHFDAAELVIFTNVPIPAMGTTNATPITRTVGGIQVVLSEFSRKPDITLKGFGLHDMATRIRVELPNKPAGVAFDFLDSTTDAGKPEVYGSSYGEYSYAELFKSLPANAHTMDITFVVQKTRTVEFLVKPPKEE